jgi:hypothetical protein
MHCAVKYPTFDPMKTFFFGNDLTGVYYADD